MRRRLSRPLRAGIVFCSNYEERRTENEHRSKWFFPIFDSIFIGLFLDMANHLPWCMGHPTLEASYAPWPEAAQAVAWAVRVWTWRNPFPSQNWRLALDCLARGQVAESKVGFGWSEVTVICRQTTGASSWPVESVLTTLYPSLVYCLVRLLDWAVNRVWTVRILFTDVLC